MQLLMVLKFRSLSPFIAEPLKPEGGGEGSRKAGIWLKKIRIIYEWKWSKYTTFYQNLKKGIINGILFSLD